MIRTPLAQRWLHARRYAAGVPSAPDCSTVTLIFRRLLPASPFKDLKTPAKCGYSCFVVRGRRLPAWWRSPEISHFRFSLE
jgi:hypothetical protein